MTLTEFGIWLNENGGLDSPQHTFFRQMGAYVIAEMQPELLKLPFYDDFRPQVNAAISQGIAMALIYLGSSKLPEESETVDIVGEIEKIMMPEKI